MSEKKYPYIGDNGLGQIVLIYGKDSVFHISGRYQGEFNDEYNETGVKNITREHLTNTYGKCESQEHADFICELAENNGFNVINDYSELKGRIWFVISCYRIEFFSNPHNTKLINLPLPPKEKEMPEVKPAIATMSPKDNNPNNKAFDVFEVKETANAFEGVRCSGEAFHCYKDYWGIEFKKPVYTKEMHERGERPPVGSEVSAIKTSSCRVRCEVLKIRDNGSFNVVAVQALEGKDDIELNELFYCALSDIKPIPTIEDDLKELAADYFEGGYKHHCYQLVSELLTKYNITPKGK